jgi:hypothetical protein
MLEIAETHARLKDERFDRPLRLRDGRVVLHRFPALRAGLLSSGSLGDGFSPTNNALCDPDRDLLS